MKLQMVMDSLDDLDDSLKDFYVERDDKFFLNVEGHHDKNVDTNRIPKARLDAEIEKRKQSDAALKEVADGYVESVPEKMRDLIPDLPPAKKIKWIQAANSKGLFNPKSKEAIDSKRPSGKQPKSLEGLSAQQKIAQGYKKK